MLSSLTLICLVACVITILVVCAKLLLSGKARLITRLTATLSLSLLCLTGCVPAYVTHSRNGIVAKTRLRLLYPSGPLLEKTIQRRTWRRLQRKSGYRPLRNLSGVIISQPQRSCLPLLSMKTVYKLRNTSRLRLCKTSSRKCGPLSNINHLQRKMLPKSRWNG